MATLYEIISFAGLAESEEPTVLKIIRESGKYHINEKTGFFGTTTVDGDAREIAEYVKAIKTYGSVEQYNQVKAVEEKRASDIQKEREKEESLRAAEATQSKKSLRETIYDLKEALPSGSQYYEYKTVTISDDSRLAKPDTELIDLTINRYALEGWRLKAVVDHNRMSVVLSSGNSISDTVLIFERLATK